MFSMSKCMHSGGERERDQIKFLSVFFYSKNYSYCWIFSKQSSWGLDKLYGAKSGGFVQESHCMLAAGQLRNAVHVSISNKSHHSQLRPQLWWPARSSSHSDRSVCSKLHIDRWSIHKRGYGVAPPSPRSPENPGLTFIFSDREIPWYLISARTGHRSSMASTKVLKRRSV